MSRSYRRQPVFGVCGGSEKLWKRFLNRRARKHNRQLISNTPVDELESLAFVTTRGLESWGPKDGKQRFDKPLDTDDAWYHERWALCMRK